MTAQVLFFDIFSEKDPHLHVVQSATPVYALVIARF